MQMPRARHLSPAARQGHPVPRGTIVFLFTRLVLPALVCALLLFQRWDAAAAPALVVEAATPLNARILQQRIDSDGPEAAARSLDHDGGWLRLRRAVGAGWINWIGLVPPLIVHAPPTEAGSLRGALRRALPTRTRQVLGALDPKNGPVFGGSVVCQRHDLLPASRLKAIRAVEAEHDIRYEERARDCLRALQGR